MPKILITDIDVGKRYRDDMGDLESLVTSINRYGLLHPIIVQKDPVSGKTLLIAGERRLRAHMELRLLEIEVKFLEDIDEVTRREIELEENIRRHNFSWVEELKAKFNLNQLKISIYGQAVKGHTTGGWSLKDTADALGESTGTISNDIQLAKALQKYPDLAKEGSKSAALKRFQRMKEKFLTEELGDRTVIPVNLECIVNQDARTWMKTLRTGSVDMILTDLPYGVDIDKGGELKDAWGSGTFDDSTYKALELYRELAKECFRVLKDNTNAYFWFAMLHYDLVKKYLEEAGFSVLRTPIIWNKESQSAPPSTPYMFTSCYEPCFLCSKGTRQLNGYYPNVITAPRVPPNMKLHPTQKPVSVLQRFIEASSNPGELVIDPCAGSGSSLMAAYNTKRIPLGCELSKEYFDKIKIWLVEYEKQQKGEEEETA